MSDILTALTMLKARGGALDLKAAEIIEDLAAQLIGKKVGEKLQARDDQITIACLEERIVVLEQEHRGVLFELDEINEKLRSALRPFLCEPCFLTPRLAADAAAEEIKHLRAQLGEAALHDAYATDAQQSDAQANAVHMTFQMDAERPWDLGIWASTLKEGEIVTFNDTGTQIVRIDRADYTIPKDKKGFDEFMDKVEDEIGRVTGRFNG